MSCSKIFSGDLPELTYEVIKYFQNDFSTLHSCILVNRLWCRLAIPLLWKDPFSISTKNYNFIEVYLRKLKSDLKTKLNEYKINDISLFSDTLFNYPSFIKYLNTWKIISSVEKWFEVSVRILEPENRYFIQNITVNDFKKLVCISIFKIFIENEVNLYTLDIEIIDDRYNSYFNNIFELIIQNSTNFIHNIRNLRLYIGSSPKVSYGNNSNEHALIKNRILQIMNLQQNLKKILFSFNSLPLYQSLLLSKDSNCSNTLITIIFYHVNFVSMINLDKVFRQLNVLESIHIIYCSCLNTGFTQQIINLTKPFKLKSLFTNETSQIESLQLLLEKSGDYLENFGFGLNNDPSLKQQFLKLIIKYCKSIKFLDFYGFEDQTIYPAFSLIENMKQNLNYLSIFLSDYNIDVSSIILQNLGQILPSKLEYLSLTLRIFYEYFKIT
jgi:hypothetical protein